MNGVNNCLILNSEGCKKKSEPLSFRGQPVTVFTSTTNPPNIEHCLFPVVARILYNNCPIWYRCHTSIINLQHTSKSPLKNNTSNTSTEHSKSPRVTKLIDLGAEAVLLLAVLFELFSLDGVVLGVSLSLALLVLLVAADVAKEDVVGNGAEKSNGVHNAGAEKKNGERSVDERVAEVAELVSVGYL